ncbi:hypothetical protein M8C21_004898, partial [Ambrosia artemisiifolia]
LNKSSHSSIHQILQTISFNLHCNHQFLVRFFTRSTIQKTLRCDIVSRCIKSDSYLVRPFSGDDVKAKTPAAVTCNEDKQEVPRTL